MSQVDNIILQEISKHTFLFDTNYSNYEIGEKQKVFSFIKNRIISEVMENLTGNVIIYYGTFK